jgi:hypothetical protein
MRTDAIDAMIADLRQIHPELQAPLSWETMSVILQRERITLLMLPLMHDAQVISCDGVSVIAINSSAPVARHTYFAAHEWAHIKLHFKEAGEIVYHTSACWPDDPREDDAEHFATQLLMGPREWTQARAAEAPEGTVRTYKDVGAIGDDQPMVHRPRRRVPKARPEQTSLPLEHHDPEDSLIAMVKHWSPRLRARLDARDRAEKASHAVLLDLRPRVETVTDDDRKRKHYFVDRDGNRWRVYDMLPAGKKSATGKPVPVEPPHNWAESRTFLGADGSKRSYSFRFREPRELEPANLERQLRAAT